MKPVQNSSRPDVVNEYSFVSDGMNVDVRNMADGKVMFRIDGGEWKEHKKAWTVDGQFVYAPYVLCTYSETIGNAVVDSKYSTVTVDSSLYDVFNVN